MLMPKWNMFVREATTEMEYEDDSNYYFATSEYRIPVNTRNQEHLHVPLMKRQPGAVMCPDDVDVVPIEWVVSPPLPMICRFSFAPATLWSERLKSLLLAVAARSPAPV